MAQFRANHSIARMDVVHGHSERFDAAKSGCTTRFVDGSETVEPIRLSRICSYHRERPPYVTRYQTLIVQTPDLLREIQ
ncbi:hypothetical protein SAMN04487950_2771 [Halogranum rubrum]|uniref:Uncharacterized protein n=1 Tax=Halogranum rubrum TaxID=553466 RepID=A0A1I4FFP4_9EURY|nr:hypothetical protein SAMN04487950_2771 [Halogranum rubrum]